MNRVTNNCDYIGPTPQEFKGKEILKIPNLPSR